MNLRRKTPLESKTPLKVKKQLKSKTPLRSRKPMAKKAKATYKPPNHKSFRIKADDLFMSRYRGLPCEVDGCGKKEGTVFHHIVNKARSKALRYDHMNGVVLCQGHHKTSNDMAPHSSNQMAVERFISWFKENCPRRHEYTQKNERINRKYTYKQAVENLKAGRDAWE
jgi:hypothetical protein